VKLTIENGVLYADNLQICYAEVKNGCALVRSGPRTVRSQYSPAHGCVLPLVDDFGWLANDAGGAIILGRVRTRNGALPCQSTLDRVVALIEQCEDNDKAVTLEVN